MRNLKLSVKQAMKLNEIIQRMRKALRVFGFSNIWKLGKLRGTPKGDREEVASEEREESRKNFS